MSSDASVLRRPLAVRHPPAFIKSALGVFGGLETPEHTGISLIQGSLA